MAGVMVSARRGDSHDVAAIDRGVAEGVRLSAPRDVECMGHFVPGDFEILYHPQFGRDPTLAHAIVEGMEVPGDDGAAKMPHRPYLSMYGEFRRFDPIPDRRRQTADDLGFGPGVTSAYFERQGGIPATVDYEFDDAQLARLCEAGIFGHYSAQTHAASPYPFSISEILRHNRIEIPVTVSVRRAIDVEGEYLDPPLIVLSIDGANYGNIVTDLGHCQYDLSTVAEDKGYGAQPTSRELVEDYISGADMERIVPLDDERQAPKETEVEPSVEEVSEDTIDAKINALMHQVVGEQEERMRRVEERRRSRELDSQAVDEEAVRLGQGMHVVEEPIIELPGTRPVPVADLSAQELLSAALGAGGDSLREVLGLDDIPEEPRGYAGPVGETVDVFEAGEDLFDESHDSAEQEPPEAVQASSVEPSFESSVGASVPVSEWVPAPPPGPVAFGLDDFDPLSADGLDEASEGEPAKEKDGVAADEVAASEAAVADGAVPLDRKSVSERLERISRELDAHEAALGIGESASADDVADGFQERLAESAEESLRDQNNKREGREQTAEAQAEDAILRGEDLGEVEELLSLADGEYVGGDGAEDFLRTVLGPEEPRASIAEDIWTEPEPEAVEEPGEPELEPEEGVEPEPAPEVASDGAEPEAKTEPEPLERAEAASAERAERALKDAEPSREVTGPRPRTLPRNRMVPGGSRQMGRQAGLANDYPYF